jgi:hypothetical protein
VQEALLPLLRGMCDRGADCGVGNVGGGSGGKSLSTLPPMPMPPLKLTREPPLMPPTLLECC